VIESSVPLFNPAVLASASHKDAEKSLLLPSVLPHVGFTSQHVLASQPPPEHVIVLGLSLRWWVPKAQLELLKESSHVAALMTLTTRARRMTTKDGANMFLSVDGWCCSVGVDVGVGLRVAA